MRIRFTRNFLDENGNLILPGPGLKSLHKIPHVEHEVFTELLSEVTPEQIQDFISGKHWLVNNEAVYIGQLYIMLEYLRLNC